MEATRYTPAQARSIFEQHYELADEIDSLINRLNALGPEVDAAREQGYAPEHESQDGILPADVRMGGHWALQYRS